MELREYVCGATVGRVCSDAQVSHLMVPEFVSTLLLKVAHTEAGKNWGTLFRVDFLKENVGNPEDSLLTSIPF